MHGIEPFYNWRHIYTAEEDERSPFYGREYSELEYSNLLYNYFIHPQWDDFGSSTLYIKILYTGYEEEQCCIIEFIGEWNDALYNDIMTLKRDVIEQLQAEGIRHFILVGENVLNFHYSDDSYYEEWFNELEDGWIAMINFRPHVIREMNSAHLGWYMHWGGELDDLDWRTYTPQQLFLKVNSEIGKRIGMAQE